MEEKDLIKIKRVYELAKRGVSGEKENAQKLLEHLCKKHGISIDSLDDNEKKKYLFKVPKTHKQLFLQIASHVTGEISYWEITPTQIKIECTAHDAIDLKETFHFFMKRYEEDLDIFYRAFISKNQLYRKQNDKDKDKDDEDYVDRRTPEEKARAWKVAQMTQGLTKHHKFKQIE